MGRFLHDHAGHRNGILYIPHPRDGPGPQLAPLHNGSIQLVASIVGEHSPLPGVEKGAILEIANYLLYRIEARPSAVENTLSDLKRIDKLGMVGFDLLVGEIGGTHVSRSSMKGYCPLGPGVIVTVGFGA
jgi:hypothetical protein